MNKLTLFICLKAMLFLSNAYAVDTSKISAVTAVNGLATSLDGSVPTGKTTQDKSTVVVNGGIKDKKPLSYVDSTAGQNPLIGKTIEFDDHMSEISGITTDPGNAFYSDSASLSSRSMSPMGSDEITGQSDPSRMDIHRKQLSAKGRQWKNENSHIFSAIFDNFTSLIAELQKVADTTSNDQYRQKIERTIHFLKGFQYNSELQCDLYEAFLDGKLGESQDEVLTEKNLRKKIEQLKFEIKRDIDYCKKMVKNTKFHINDSKQIDPIINNLNTMRWALTTASPVQLQKGANFSW